MKWYWWIIIVVVIVLIIYRKRASKFVMETWNDLVTNQRIQSLHPAIREKAKAFIAEAARQGIKLRMIEGLRSFDRSNALFNQPFDGKDNDGDGKIDETDEKVTNAKGGQSYHNYGLAFDVVEIKNGKGVWENPNWPKIGAIGKSFGFRWGGDFKSLVDRPHFEYSAGFSVSQLLAMHNAGKKDADGYLTNIA